MLYRKLQRVWARRKAVSPVVATILIIALTVVAGAIIYFVVVPLLRGSPELVVLSSDFEDTTGSDFANKFTAEIGNIGSEGTTIKDIVVKRGETVVEWSLQNSNLTVEVASQKTLVCFADTENDEVGYGDFVTVEIPFASRVISMEFRMTAEFGPFVLLYEEDFEGGTQPEGWTHYMFTTLTGNPIHGSVTSLDDWILTTDPIEGDQCWQCTTNNCQFIVLDSDDYDFYDVNISYDLRTRDDDSNGIIFRYDNTGAFPKFYIAWFTEDHPGPRNGVDRWSQEAHNYNWNTPSDEIKEDHITIHYVEGYDAGSGAMGFKWYKLAEAPWSRGTEWYTWRVIADLSNFELQINGETKLTCSDARISNGNVGLISFANEDSYYDNIYVWKTTN